MSGERENAAELRALQALIDRSHARTGPYMKSITQPEKYSLGAKQVVKLLDGMKTVAVGAPALSGDRLVAPMDGGLRARPRASSPTSRARSSSPTRTDPPC